MGRPLKFESVEYLQARIDAYFAECDPHVLETEEWVEARDAKGQLKKDKHGLSYLVKVKHKVRTEQVPYTITGLALALDTSRETLLEYEERPEFVDTIKRAKLKCQNFAERQLFSPAPTGSIFNLKNNYGWIDKSVQEHEGGLYNTEKVTVEVVRDQDTGERDAEPSPESPERPADS